MIKVEKLTKLEKFNIEVHATIAVEDVPSEVKELLNDDATFIEQFNEDFGYIIFRNDVSKKEAIFTRKNSDEAYKYVAPSEFCRDADRI